MFKPATKNNRILRSQQAQDALIAQKLSAAAATASNKDL